MHDHTSRRIENLEVTQCHSLNRTRQTPINRCAPRLSIPLFCEQASSCLEHRVTLDTENPNPIRTECQLQRSGHRTQNPSPKGLPDSSDNSPESIACEDVRYGVVCPYGSGKKYKKCCGEATVN